MYDVPTGKYVRGYLASSDISTAAIVPLFDANGAAYTLLVGERLVIDSLSLNNGATASKITVFSDANGNAALDAGEALYTATLPINGQSSPNLLTPILSRQITPAAANGVLYAVASVASVGSVVFLTGHIITS